MVLTPRPRRKGSGATYLLAFSVLALVFAGAAFWAGLSPSSPSVDVRLEGTADPGPAPYTAPVGQDRAGVLPPAEVTGRLPGDTEGLYARAGTAPSCDVAALTAALAADPAKARAWADAHGADTPAGLTPVLLRHDTAVTEHGFGTPAHQAVLQAGSAVLVDALGVPRVRCTSGNPLDAARVVVGTEVTGEPWQFFQPSLVTYVDPAGSPLTALTVLDLDGGELVQQPVG
ncbi:MAG: hypothetical protein OJJ54_00710 [Pseudonocardia sp.]|nr:hypothetical protein [Pseudonocardia sp.]